MLFGWLWWIVLQFYVEADESDRCVSLPSPPSEQLRRRRNDPLTPLGRMWKQIQALEIDRTFNDKARRNVMQATKIIEDCPLRVMRVSKNTCSMGSGLFWGGAVFAVDDFSERCSCAWWNNKRTR